MVSPVQSRPWPLPFLDADFIRCSTGPESPRPNDIHRVFAIGAAKWGSPSDRGVDVQLAASLSSGRLSARGALPHRFDLQLAEVLRRTTVRHALRLRPHRSRSALRVERIHHPAHAPRRPRQTGPTRQLPPSQIPPPLSDLLGRAVLRASGFLSDSEFRRWQPTRSRRRAQIAVPVAAAVGQSDHRRQLEPLARSPLLSGVRRSRASSRIRTRGFRRVGFRPLEDRRRANTR